MITDVRGVPLPLREPPRRVVSLVPSVTETLFDLGAGDSVVGVTDFCVFPPEAATRSRVGGTKNPSVERIRALEPDLVYVNLEENLRRHAEEIEVFAPVFATEPRRLEDVLRLFVVLGEIHRCRDGAQRLAESLRREVAGMGTRSFTFACAIWKDPWMWCGGDTYVSDLVTTGGGRNVLAGRTRYPKAGVEEILALDPEFVFLPDEPFLFTEDDARALRVKESVKVIGPFPGHLFTWHGSRTIPGLRFLRETLTSCG
jgi:ABC-type Fe3+-hydroxamate transport system substrate-binding protein